jgi:hypothetical protein
MRSAQAHSHAPMTANTMSIRGRTGVADARGHRGFGGLSAAARPTAGRHRWWAWPAPAEIMRPSEQASARERVGKGMKKDDGRAAGWARFV